MTEATANLITTASAAITAVFAVLIWWVYKGQWKTMNEQAEYMRDGLVETRKAADAARASAEAAQSGVDIARATMVADQRPWVSVDIEHGHLEYDPGSEGQRWKLRVKFHLRQHGKTPATNVSVVAELLPCALVDGQRTDVKPIFERLFTMNEHMAGANLGFSRMLFPSESLTLPFVIGRGPFEVPARSQSTGQMLVVVGVTYGSTLGDDKYRTGKAFFLLKRSQDHISFAGESVGADDLALVLNPSSAHYAN